MGVELSGKYPGFYSKLLHVEAQNWSPKYLNIFKNQSHLKGSFKALAFDCQLIWGNIEYNRAGLENIYAMA